MTFTVRLKFKNIARKSTKRAILGFAPSVIEQALKYLKRSKACGKHAPQSKSYKPLPFSYERLMNLPAVEDYRPGYPRYSALIGSDDSFHICRRFSMLRARLLLQKQDKLSLLEKELERLDREEVADLFLGSNRLDGNTERQRVLCDVDTALADYGRQPFPNASFRSLDLMASMG